MSIRETSRVVWLAVTLLLLAESRSVLHRVKKSELSSPMHWKMSREMTLAGLRVLIGGTNNFSWHQSLNLFRKRIARL